MGNKNPWNRGRTKNDHSGLAKISQQRHERNNFSDWYEQRRRSIEYVDIKPSADYAELYGAIVGDGCIETYPRTERLIISFNSKEVDHIAHIKRIVERVFKKEATLRHRNNANCTDIYIYQKHISERLNFPTGVKYKQSLPIPEWINGDRAYLLLFLKGLFEADGSWVIDQKYNTNVIALVSASPTLLKDIYDILIGLGFHAKLHKKDVRLAQRAETEKFAKLINFRQY